MFPGLVKAITLGIVAAVTGVFAVTVGIIAIFLYAILGALIGAIAGWLVSVTPILGPLVVAGFKNFGILNADLVAIGSTLGFVAGFFKSSPTGGRD